MNFVNKSEVSHVARDEDEGYICDLGVDIQNFVCRRFNTVDPLLRKRLH